MSDRALDAEEQERLDSLRGDLKSLREDMESSVPAPEIPDELLRNLVLQSSPHATLPIKYLSRCGYDPPPPGSLDDERLTAELWKLIWVMGLLRMFLNRTDHLTDRELYTYLYEDALREPTAFRPGEESPPFYHYDLLMAGGTESSRLLLTYYADVISEDERYDHLGYLELDEPPEPRPRPADRDRFLP